MADDDDTPVADGPKTSFTLYDHPRARRSVERTRSWAALLTFAGVAALSKSIGVEDFTVVVRGLVAGTAMFVVAWAISVAVWKEIVRTELASAKVRAQERRADALRALEESRLATLERVRERKATGG